MALDIPAVQRALAEEHLDGWLLYDFHGANPIAQRLAALEGKHTTRRWYYFIPANGTPRKLVHSIEAAVLAELPGDTCRYAGRLELATGIAQLVQGSERVAMEYSPGCAIPYVSRVDAGTIEVLRGFGLTIVSSGDLVGRFEAAWGPAEIETHRAASEKLYRIKERAFEYIGRRLAQGVSVDERQVQDEMMVWFSEEGLVTDSPPIVAVDAHAGDPHYAPTPESSEAIGRNQLVLLDLWGKLGSDGAVYADITWTGVTGPADPEVVRVFGVVVRARDAALEFVQSRVGAGEPVRGWEVDRAARDVIVTAGYGDRFIHRTGHSLGQDVHGNGVHMDDYETHDDRRLLVGTGFTIEPGIYLNRFGIRSEINVVVGARTAEATGALQTELVQIL
jgi:Xaa-Pro dipeptidase